MNRLTKTYSDGTHGANDNLPCGENSYTYKGLLLESLGKYEDLEEQNLLLRLPCKVGDTVYVLCKNIVTEKQVYDVQYRGGITYQKGQRWYVNIGGLAYYEMDFGKTVFFTQEEAEQKLKEKEMGIRPSYSNYSTKRIIERLTEYEDAEEQGLLLRLPCKVGDTVWDNDYGKPCAYTITGFSFGTGEDYIDEPVSLREVVCYYSNYSGSITGSFAVSEIGKTLFLTKEEAEQKLKEMESDSV